MSFQAKLPNRWTWLPLKRGTELLGRGTAPDYIDDGPVRIIGQAANQASGLDWERTRFHDYAGTPHLLKGFLKPNDLLVNSTGTGTLGRVGFYRQGPDERPCAADGHVTVVRADTSVIHPRYLYYWMISALFQDYIYAALTVGSTNQIELNAERFAAALIALPPLDEQYRIADFLDSETARIDRLVSLQASTQAGLKAREQAQLDLEVDRLVSEYGVKPFRRFITGIEQGSSPQCENSSSDPDEWGVLKVSAVKNGRFLPGENKRLPDDIAPEKRYEIKDGDLLITRANTPALVGATAVARAPRPKLMLCDKIFRVQVGPDLDKDFMSCIARGTRIRDLCALAANGASPSMVNIRAEEVKAWPVPGAPVDVQRQTAASIAAKSKSSQELQMRITSQLTLLAERRQALITAAVTGLFDVTTARKSDSSEVN